MSIPGRLTAMECAALIGVLPGTWRSYVARSQAPAPVEHVGRTPLWDADEVTSWARGYRKGRSARERTRDEQVRARVGALPLVRNAPRRRHRGRPSERTARA